MNSARVSIICPYRNASPFLGNLIANVQAQRLSNWELLLVNDGSQDDGPALVARAASSDSRLRPLEARNRPPGAAKGPWWPRNQGLSHATAPWVTFLDADDLWHPHKLDLQLALHEKESLDLSVTGYGRFRSSDEQLVGWRCPPATLPYRSLLQSNVLPLLTLMVRRELLSNGFPACVHEDYLCWLNLFQLHPQLRYGHLPDLLGFYRLHSGNLTGRRWTMAHWTFQVYRRHGLGPLASALGLVPWLWHQGRASWWCLKQPLMGALQPALWAEPPWRLPPT